MLVCLTSLNLDPLSAIGLTAIILLVVAVQSMFGVGVLFLRTPILLFLGFSIVDTLEILFPISLLISVIQVAVGWKDVQWKAVKTFVLYALPFAVIGTLLLKVVVNSAMFPLAVAIYLMIVALGFYFRLFPGLILKLTSRETLYLSIVGLMHGLTNLGGPLLTSYVLAKYPDKKQSRSTIAICYGLFVIVQIMTLRLSGLMFTLHDQYRIHSILALLVFVVMNKFVFLQIKDQVFRTVFGFLLLLMSVLLLIKYLA